MDWKSAQHNQDGATIIPKRWLHLHYYEALNILFRTENSLRIFVYTILKNNFFEKWADSAIQISDGEQSTISSLTKKRIAQAQGFGYLGYKITSPLMHLNSGELVRLITSETYWSIFKGYFKGKKDIIRTKLDEVGTVRNSLAHFRPIKNDDIELIKQNVKHALIGVEECLSEMTSAYNVVPTNTVDKWYKELVLLGTDLCGIQLYQSRNEEWLRIQITFKSKILERSHWWSEYYSYTVLNFNTPSIIQLYENLRKYVTYVAENVSYATINEDLMPEFSKSISFVFRKDVFSSNSETINDDIKNMLLKVQEEVTLVEEDNLAKGELISTARASAELKKSEDDDRWVTDSEGLKCIFQEDDPAEYWGDVGLYHQDFIAGITKYPWMPSGISDKESPFDY